MTGSLDRSEEGADGADGSAALNTGDLVAAIDTVVDPCSQAMGMPLGLAEMGLATVIGLDVPAGAVAIRLRLTSPCCAYGPTMAAAVERAVAGVAGVSSVDVMLDHAAMWEPTMISSPATARLAARRRRTLATTDARPYDWSGHAHG